MPANPKAIKVLGAWKGKSAGGCINYPTWRFNPQVFLSSDKKKSVTISLVQDTVKGEDPLHIGFYVAIADGSGRRQLILSKESLLEKTKFEDVEKVELEISVEPGVVYVIIPCSFRPREERKFSLIFTSLPTIKVAPFSPSKEWKCVTGKAEWRRHTAGGCKNHPTCAQNPQFLIRTKRSTKATILLARAQNPDFKDAIGLYVLKSKASAHKTSKIRSEKIIAKSDFGRGMEATLSLQLDSKSKYIILPCTFEPGSEINFSVTLFTENDVRLKALKDPKEVSLKSEVTDEDAGGSLEHPTWRSNPQFFLTVEKDAKLTISLEQLGESLESIGFYVAPSNFGSKLLYLTQENTLAHTGFKKEQIATAEVTLKKSDNPYVILPCSQSPLKPFKYSLSVRLEQVLEPNCSSSIRAPKVFQLYPCSTEWRRKFHQGYWIGSFKGGSRDSADFFSNPQYLLEVTEPAKVALLLYLKSPREDAGGMYIFKAPKGADANTTVSSQNVGELVAECPFLDHFENCLQTELAPGAYYILCCLKTPNKTGEYELSVYSDIDSFTVDPAGADQSWVKQKNVSLRSLGEVNPSDIAIGEKLGQGGFGAVYKGEWQGHTVAVKKISCSNMEDREFSSFQKEVEIMSKLHHDNVLGCLGASLNGNDSVIITEFMPKGNLSEVLQQEPDLPWTTVVRMALDAAEGMTYLHSMTPPIVHRDLKSLNLLVGANYQVKVADFGLSKATSGNSLNSKVGSLNWCAPEILLKRMPYTKKSDVYSFGMVLYELTAKEPPFHGCNPLQVVRAIDSGELPEVPKGTNEAFAQLIEDCWKTEPEDRPEFEEVVERLKSPEMLAAPSSSPRVN